MSGTAANLPTAPVAAAGLLGGYAIARFSRRRELGGLAMAAAGAWCARSWREAAGTPTAAVILAVYLGGFGASHPLAKRIGPWPAVLTAAGTSAAAAHLLADRRA